MLKQTTANQIDNHISLAQIEQHVVLESNWVSLTDEDSVSDAQVFDQVSFVLRLVHDLEVSTPVLLSSLFALVRDHKVVDDTFLNKN